MGVGTQVHPAPSFNIYTGGSIDVSRVEIPLVKDTKPHTWLNTYYSVNDLNMLHANSHNFVCCVGKDIDFMPSQTNRKIEISLSPLLWFPHLVFLGGGSTARQCGILVSWPGFEPMPPAVEVLSLRQLDCQGIFHHCAPPPPFSLNRQLKGYPLWLGILFYSWCWKSCPTILYLFSVISNSYDAVFFYP